MENVFNDERFAHIASDPRFKDLPKQKRKVKIDKRFQSIFNDKQFQVNYTVDKRGRPINHTSSDNFRKYYELSSDEDESNDESINEEKNDDNEVTSHEEINDGSKLSNKSKLKNDISIIKKVNKCSVISDKKSNLIVGKELISEKSSDGSDSEKDTDLKRKQSKSSELDASKKHQLPDDIRNKLHDLKVDYARGMGTLMTDSSSDDDTDEDQDVEEELEHNWGELDRDAEITDSATHRLAICNMDWDRIRAVDLMVLCSSFLPSGGHIKSITIYPSEFGLKRMKEEELKGPIELAADRVEYNDDDQSDNNDDEDEDDESKEGSKYHMERLRQYQLNRLKYFYGVIVCDSVETASKLYSECDGMEYESSATKLDLRFIPDDTTFDEKPKEVCSELPDLSKYEPRFFVNTALQQGKVSCTWDETDPARIQVAEKLRQMKGGTENLNDDELQMFLASSSEDEDNDDNNTIAIKNENEEDKANDESSEETDSDSSDNDKTGKTTNKSIEKYRDLLNKIHETEEKKKNRDVEMEITWGVGLKDKAQTLVDKKIKENADQTPFEQLIEKKKEKRKQKREEKLKNKKGLKNKDDGSSENEDALFSDDDIPDDIDMNDDYFKEEFKNDRGTNKKLKKKNTKKADDIELDDEERQKREQLELLMLDDDQEDGKKHFSLKKIQEMEEECNTKKKRKGRKQLIKNNRRIQQKLGDNGKDDDDDFEVDVTDNRFSAIYESHHFNIDPADPHYRKTKGMESLIKEKINRKYQKSSDQIIEDNKPPLKKMLKLDSDLSNVVSNIKKKTEGLK